MIMMIPITNGDTVNSDNELNSFASPPPREALQESVTFDYYYDYCHTLTMTVTMTTTILLLYCYFTVTILLHCTVKHTVKHTVPLLCDDRARLSLS